MIHFASKRSCVRITIEAYHPLWRPTDLGRFSHSSKTAAIYQRTTTTKDLPTASHILRKSCEFLGNIVTKICVFVSAVQLLNLPTVFNSEKKLQISGKCSVEKSVFLSDVQLLNLSTVYSEKRNSEEKRVYSRNTFYAAKKNKRLIYQRRHIF